MVFFVEIAQDKSMISFVTFSFDCSFFLQVLQCTSTLCNEILKLAVELCLDTSDILDVNFSESL